MDETWPEKIAHASVFLVICTAIIFVGWHEPIAYRFMKPQEIFELENPPQPVAARRPSAMEWSSRTDGTALDRAPYSRTRSGAVHYSNNIDQYRAGTATETDPRTGLVWQRGKGSVPVPDRAAVTKEARP